MNEGGAVPVDLKSSRGRGEGLYAQVVESIGQDIVSGNLRPGSIVYADQIVQRLGISRSVVRESLRSLSSLGLVESRPRVGTRVLPRARWDLLNPNVVYWRGRGPEYRQQQRELLELRLGVEGAAARFAAKRISPTTASEILAKAAAMLAATEANDPMSFFDADAQFHRLLLEGSGNAVLAQFADTVEAVLRARSIDQRPGMSTLTLTSARRHIRLAQALLERNETEAEAWAREIVEYTLKEFEPAEAERETDQPSEGSDTES
jgi:DNA-binding FadR family transcriptional regulator